MFKKIAVIAAFCISLTPLAHGKDPYRGQRLFADPTLGGGTKGKSCFTCHKLTKNLGRDLFSRAEFKIKGKEKATLVDVINHCIESAMGGKAIDPQGKDMKDLLAYMRIMMGDDKKEKKMKKKKYYKKEGC